jgi:ribosomal protein S18 acetylase RimI-like enzyme
MHEAQDQPEARDITILPITSEDREWMRQFMREHWDGELIVSRNKTHNAIALEGFIALFQGEKAGLITYSIEGNSCEIVTLDSIKPDVGIGTALIEAVKEAAQQQGCKRLWLITTNDNLHALGFYQKRGFELVAVHRNAVEAVRRVKPQVPLTGYEGIPLRDEIELEIMLA